MHKQKRALCSPKNMSNSNLCDLCRIDLARKKRATLQKPSLMHVGTSRVPSSESDHSCSVHRGSGPVAPLSHWCRHRIRKEIRKTLFLCILSPSTCVRSYRKFLFC